MSETDVTQEPGQIEVKSPDGRSKLEINLEGEGRVASILGAELIEQIQNSTLDDVGSATENLSKSVQAAYSAEEKSFSLMLKQADLLTQAYVKMAAYDTQLRVALNSLDGSGKQYQNNFGAALAKAGIEYADMERAKRAIRWHTDYVMREILPAEVFLANDMDPRTRSERRAAANEQKKLEAENKSASTEAVQTEGEAVAEDEAVQEAPDVFRFAERANKWAAETHDLIEHATTIERSEEVVRLLASALKHCRQSIERVQSLAGTTQEVEATG